ncbi:MAG TPA: hypothetical protein VGP82_18890, partial [Ktedonobacterales bacterium]|nr:hypothetical protein [Ktedonobacterales bacterium]
SSSEAVATRLKEQFAPAYLTLTSIIQAVALSALVVRVEATYERFNAADWLLVIATLLAFLLIWHEYLMQALAYVWLPTLLDSLVPFAYLVVELFTAHLAYGDQRIWLLSVGIGFIVGVISWGTASIQSRAHASENRGVLEVVQATARARIYFNLVPCVLFLGGWALYDVLDLAQLQFVIALLAALLIALRIAATVPYWNRVLNYAHGRS